LSESLSPTSPWGMPFEGADACGVGAGGGAGAACLTGLGAGAGAGLATGVWAGLGAAAAADCFVVAGEFELLPLLPPQLATPTATRRIAAAVARKVIGLLRFMGVLQSEVWGSGRFPAAGPLVVGRRETHLPATGAVVRAAGDAVDSRLALPGGGT
jgi:hypothetical protein